MTTALPSAALAVVKRIQQNELTGYPAGFAFALQNTRLVALISVGVDVLYIQRFERL